MLPTIALDIHSLGVIGTFPSCPAKLVMITSHMMAWSELLQRVNHRA